MHNVHAWLGAWMLCLAFPVTAQGWRGWQAGPALGFGEVRGAIQSGSVFVSPGFSPADGTFFAPETVSQLATAGEALERKGRALPGLALAWNEQDGHRVQGWMLDMARMPLRLRSEVAQSYLAPCCNNAGFTLRQSMDTSALLAFRARAGWAQGDWLWYGSAGLALTDLRVQSHFRDTSEDAAADLARSRWRAGLALGLGAERRLSSDWFWRLEWLRVDFGKARHQVNNLASPVDAFPNSPWIAQARVRADRLSIGLQRRW